MKQKQPHSTKVLHTHQHKNQMTTCDIAPIITILLITPYRKKNPSFISQNKIQNKNHLQCHYRIKIAINKSTVERHRAEQACARNLSRSSFNLTIFNRETPKPPKLRQCPIQTNSNRDLADSHKCGKQGYQRSPNPQSS